MKLLRWTSLAGAGALTVAVMWCAVPTAGDGGTGHVPTASSLRPTPSGALGSQALVSPAHQGDSLAALPPHQTQRAAAATGLTAEELDALRAELATHPKGEAEFQRVVGFLNFSRQWEAFQTTHQQGTDQAALRTLAQAIDDALPARWQHGELTSPQALQIKARLLDVLMPDASSRQQALLQWREQHQAAVRTTPAESAFLAEQARLVEAWQAQRPGQRLPEPLIAQLEILRQKSFAGPAPHNPAQGKQP